MFRGFVLLLVLVNYHTCFFTLLSAVELIDDCTLLPFASRVCMRFLRV